MCTIVNQPHYRYQHPNNDCWNDIKIKIKNAKPSLTTPQSSVSNLLKNIKIQRDKFAHVNKLKYVNECGIILFNQDFSKLLIVYQNISQKWGFPKGKMFDEEKQYGLYYDCASREMLEETGICLKHYRKKYKKINGAESSVIIKNKLFFLLSTDSVYVRNCYPSDTEEIGQTRWINTNELGSFIKNNNCNITLRYIYDYMTNDYITDIDNIDNIDNDIDIDNNADTFNVYN